MNEPRETTLPRETTALRELGGATITAWLGPLAIAVAIAPVLQRAVLRPEALPPHLGWWSACIAAFAAADQIAIRRRFGTGKVATLGLCTVLACAATWLIPAVYGGAGMTAALLVVVAARLHDLGTGPAFGWIVAQSLVLGAIYVGRWDTEVGVAAAFGFFGFQIIGYRFSRTAASERRARTELAAARSELTAAARRAERNQIAADLHDVLGHHLVALQLQLQAATGVDGDRHLAQARQLGRLLLAEVRGVVDEMQGRESFDFEAALRELADRHTSPPVTVAISPAAGLDRLEPAAGRECFRAVQEAVTNARKHAHARSIAVAVERGTIVVRDDGRSFCGPAVGRGLSGMAERCREAGCGFALDRQPGAGTTVTITLPGVAASGARS